MKKIGLAFGLWAVMNLASYGVETNRVEDVTVTNIGSTTITFTWPVIPGAISNDVRVATNVISTFNWNNTNQVPERFLLDAGMPGTRETWFLSERQTNTLYYVALKVLTTNGWTMMSKLVRVMTRDSLATVRVVWDMPTNNVDGSVLTDLAGAKIYYGLESSNYTTVIDVGFVTTYVISNLLEGVSYYVSCTAYNTSGIESGFSKELYKPIP